VLISILGLFLWIVVLLKSRFSLIGDALTGDAHQEIWHEGFQVCEA